MILGAFIQKKTRMIYIKLRAEHIILLKFSYAF